MTQQPTTRFSILERLDLALANGFAGRIDELERAALGEPPGIALGEEATPAQWASGLLALRGLVVAPADAEAILGGTQTRLGKGRQEHELVLGLDQMLRQLRTTSGQGIPPTGWFMVDLFRTFTRRIARFTNNAIRRDPPWDALLHVTYPPPGEVRFLIDTFDRPHAYRDFPVLFERMHPVRQSFRVLWRFARLAPFPDFNLVMAFMAMNAHLLAHGYPMVRPLAGDRELLVHLVSGPPPLRHGTFESRLLLAAGA